MSEGLQELEEHGDHHVILFYKYHPLAKDCETVEQYRGALERFCQSLQLKGRILVGCNPKHQAEGINGTLSSRTKSHVEAFVTALCHKNEVPEGNDKFNFNSAEEAAIRTFWKEAELFYEQAQCPPLVMEGSEFKWSKFDSRSSDDATSDGGSLFPDLNIKIVSELIGTGGVLASIPIEETAKGYLTPKEWHERLKQRTCNNASHESGDVNANETVLIDCRNTKEFQIGHFQDAIDPKTTTFGQFPAWVQQHSETLKNKSVLMYCTGGIRCEKASAYIRRQVPSVKEVLHLKGGIHKYLDEFGDNPRQGSLWKGKNFVFDGRGAATAPGAVSTPSVSTVVEENKAQETSSAAIVGKCIYCRSPYDVFDPHCICTVCREPTLVCKECQSSGKLMEFHCENHFAWKNCYFTHLSRFSNVELEQQLHELQALAADIAVGKRYKQRRKTLQKQCQKICKLLSEKCETNIQSAGNPVFEEVEKRKSGDLRTTQMELKCRSCGEIGCSGHCWGFHGLKRKRILESNLQTNVSTQTEEGNSAASATKAATVTSGASRKKRNNNEHLQVAKELQRQREIDELVHLELSQPPSAHWDRNTCIRLPPPCIRVLKTTTKGKWCGKTVLQIIRNEFHELSNEEVLMEVLTHGLLRVQSNNEQDFVTIRSLEQAESIRLKNMDILSRIVHWHEPPVLIPKGSIGVQKIELSDLIRKEHDFDGDNVIYVCDKPSTVPVHPSGPYLANSLTLMAEAQLGMSPKSLIPCHRIDKVTSGLTLLASNAKVARLIHCAIDAGRVSKLYLAKVKGKFPATSVDTEGAFGHVETSNFATWEWKEGQDKKSAGILQVDAPIETVDPANGIRMITTNGKPAQSLFQLVEYDQLQDVSTLSCSPLTGRSHQLRVHLRWLGFPILNDTQYGGIEDCATRENSKLGVARIAESATQTNETRKQQSLSDKDAEAACEACRCRREGATGIISSFSPAQTLQGGHSICLHAFRYKIPIHPKKATERNKVGAEKSSTPIDVLDLKVELPVWSPSLPESQLQWLSNR